MSTDGLTEDEREALRQVKRKSPNGHWIEVAVEQIVADRERVLRDRIAELEAERDALTAICEAKRPHAEKATAIRAANDWRSRAEAETEQENAALRARIAGEAS